MTKRRIIILAILLPLIVMVACIVVANAVVYDLSRPKPSRIPARAAMGEYSLEPARFESSDGVWLSGWHVKVPGTKAVVLLHGIGANRLQHIPKAVLFAELGYAVLTYDSRGHGESESATVTGGWTERLDLEAAVAYMREQGYIDVGLVGFSMGAATITYADHQTLKPAFIVLESCFKDVETLLKNAVGWVGLPEFMAMPVLARIAGRMDIPLAELSPLRRLANITTPTLILLGDTEFQVSKAQADEMLLASAARLKRCFVFENAGHDVFSETEPVLYRRHLTQFLHEVDRVGAAALSWRTRLVQFTSDFGADEDFSA